MKFEQKSPKVFPNYLFFDIHVEATVSNPQGYLVFYGVAEWSASVPPAIYDGTIEDSMFLFDNGKMKMNMDLDMNGHGLINFRPEEYFYIGGYYKSSVRTNFILFGNNKLFTKVPFTGYLIGVEVIITKDAHANDNKFLLRIVGRNNIATGSTILRAACCNHQLYPCKIEKFDFLKLCHNKRLC